MTYHPIGEIFKYEDTNLVVIKDKNTSDCRKCFFYKKSCHTTFKETYCGNLVRRDNESISYIELTDKQVKKLESFEYQKKALKNHLDKFFN